PQLLAALQDSEPKVREYAAWSLGTPLGKDRKEVVEALLKLLPQEKDADVRAAAVSALGSHGPGAAAALPAILQVLDGKDSYPSEAARHWARHCAIEALLKIKPEDKRVSAALLQVFKERDAPDTRGDAAWALAQIAATARDVLPVLLTGLK